MDPNDNKVRAAIEDILRGEIHSGTIINVLVDRGLDAEGEPVLIVRTIFENKARRIKAEESIGVRRRVRDVLSKFGESRAPLFYYIEKSEAGNLAEAH